MFEYVTNQEIELEFALPPDTLYHYCSTDAFLSIIANKSIRLSAIKQSNDAMEGKLLSHTVEYLALGSGLDNEIVERMQRQIASGQATSDAYGFCLSTKGDLLSQWRGYADDGMGVAIGFSQLSLRKLAQAHFVSGARLSPVVYGRDDQAAIVKPHFDAAYAKFSAAPREYGSRLLETRTQEEILKGDLALAMAQATLFEVIVELILPSYTFKSQAFSEESEWRMLDTMQRRPDKDLRFRARGAQVIPYLHYDFADLAPQMVNCVVCGPKHTTPENVIVSLLEQAGYKNFTLHQSELTYR